jgi:type IV pilus assembly protein PilV
MRKKFNSPINRVLNIGSSRGFTMVETLVTVLVASIGLLGLAKLNALGMQNNQSAYWRTQATYLAYDMADRMRANDVGITAGSYDQPSATYTSSCFTTAGCSESQMAQSDFYQWKNTVAALLPNGTGMVCLTSTPASGTSTAPACDGATSVYAIKIWWTDEVASGDSSTQDEYFFYLNFEP